MTGLIDDLSAEFDERAPWQWPSPLEVEDRDEVDAALSRLREKHPGVPAAATWLFRARFIGALDGGMRLDEDLNGFAARCWAQALREAGNADGPEA